MILSICYFIFEDPMVVSFLRISLLQKGMCRREKTAGYEALCSLLLGENLCAFPSCVAVPFMMHTLKSLRSSLGYILPRANWRTALLPREWVVAAGTQRSQDESKKMLLGGCHWLIAIRRIQEQKQLNEAFATQSPQWKFSEAQRSRKIKFCKKPEWYKSDYLGQLHFIVFLWKWRSDRRRDWSDVRDNKRTSGKP